MKKKYKFQNPGRTIKEMLALSTEKFPANSAFKVKNRGKIESVSFLQLTKDLRNLGTELHSLELSDKRVGIIGENSYPWFNVFLSVVCGGGVAVPFDKGFTPEELATCITRSGISALFYDEKHSEMVHKAAEIAVEGSEKEQVTLFKMTGESNVIDQMKISGELKIKSGNTDYINIEISENSPAVILFTSGTTSSSKAVVLTHNNILSNTRDMHEYEDFYPDDVNMAFLPLHHSFGLGGVIVFMAAGACSVFCDGLKYITKNLAEYGVTVFVGVPLLVENMYKKIMQQVKKSGLESKIAFGNKVAGTLDKVGIHVRRKIFKQVIDNLGGKLRLIICGAAPLMPEAGKGLNDFGIVTIQGYGLTETSPVLCAERPQDICPGSVGKPMPSVTIRIANPDEKGIGEIVAKAPNVMWGYLDQPEETAEVIRDGWFYTGDLGCFDSEGHLWISGRKKNVIVMKNGKNIFPEEIESIVVNLPYVDDCMVFTREKHNELVLWLKIVYNADYLRQEGITEEQLAETVKKDLRDINNKMPQYKHVNHFILDDEPMIQTTTKKVKRNPEIERINANRETERWYTVD
ncbi:MAG: AMP-binding protein [Firmicutes bacterium]|nr:AMP-binding protein [Bacillota bacterium]